MVLPEGAVVPPLPYLVVLVAGVVGVAAALRRTNPRVTGRLVVAFAPWMVVGAALNVLHAVHALPAVIAPFFGTPAVYFTTFVVAGTIWLVAIHFGADVERLPAPATTLLAFGIALTAVLVTGTLGWGAAQGTLRFAWPLAGVVVATVVTAVVWYALDRTLPRVVATTGTVGALVIFSHALDGVSTAIGIDVFGLGERTPLSRAIIDLAAALPTAHVLGTVWLFVTVKLLLATLIVWLFAGYVREEPTQGYLLLAVVASVGLGPAVHNLLLFVISG